MIIPDSFKNAIASTFYDKTFQVYTSNVVKDAVGWKKKEGTSVVSGTFVGNTNYNKLEKVQEDYGISEAVDMVITTNTFVEMETIIGLSGKQYKVIKTVPFDSHYLLLAQRWSSKSQTSISA